MDRPYKPFRVGVQILGSSGWQHGRNALFIVFDEGNGR